VTFSRTLASKAAAVFATCRRRRLTLAIAESCTGGLISAALTEIPGSSEVFDRGYVTYSNAAKTALLAVPARLIKRDGAVSETVARVMAKGARSRAGTDIAVSVTGIAGPSGATPDKPVGLVHIVADRRGRPAVHCRRVFKGSRSAVRQGAAIAALDMVLRLARRR
jgi:nicotinamide-nucleotide amidase